jgi:hypothetical protein
VPLSKHGFLGTEIATWVARIRGDHAAFFSLVDEINTHCQEAMYKLAPHSKLMQEILVATLFMRALSNFQGAIVLAERGMMSQSRVMERTAIEGLFILCAISRDEKYAKEFISDDHRERLAFLDKFRKFHGGKLPDDVDAKEVEALEAELKEEVKAGEIRKKSTEQWAKDADMHNWYLSVYAVLSQSVHSKVKDLESYLVRDQNEEVVDLQWGPTDAGIENVLMTAVQSMLIALKCTARVFGGIDAQVETYQQQLDALIVERL